MLLGDPLLYRLHRGRVDVAIHPSDGFQEHIAQEIGSEDGIIEIQKGMSDLGSVGVVLPNEFFGAFLAEQRVRMIGVLRDPRLDRLPKPWERGVVEKHLPCVSRNCVQRRTGGA